MPRYKLTVAYDGTNYCGWQVQKQGASIQSLIQKALETALRHPVDLTGSGRTDAGVHALGQTAHFDTELPCTAGILRTSLNALLPIDIRVLDVEEVPSGFHARYSALRKIYHYNLHLEPMHDPLSRLYSAHIAFPIDRRLLESAAKKFIGRHDFTSFCNAGTAVRSGVRTLFRLDITDRLCLEFEGDGFLYKMVRNITGTLIDVARGKIAASRIESIFAARDRRAAGAAAPPHGLFLMQVVYRDL